jgi:hypothetical protein
MLKLAHSGTPEPPDPRKTRLNALLAIKYGREAESAQVHGEPVAAEISSLQGQGVGRAMAAGMLAEHNAALRRAHGRN